MTTLTVNSRQPVEMIEITSEVRNIIRATGISAGIAVIYTPHTTAAITINENADPDVAHDMVTAINKLVPLEDQYRHLEGNSAAHLKSCLFGASETVIVHRNDAVLGTWQGLYFCEFDGPRQRQVHVQVIGA